MAKDTTESRPGHEVHPNSLANLRTPVQKGDPPRNPKGHNQYTYREDTEKRFAKMCEERIDAVLKALFDEAETNSAKNSPDRKLVLERALPAVKQVELDLPGADVPGLIDALATRAAKRRTGGGDSEPDGSAEDGGA